MICSMLLSVVSLVLQTGCRCFSGGAGAGRRQDVQGSPKNGGMATLTLLALFVVPVAYSLIDHIIELA